MIIVVLYRQFKLDVFCRECTELSTLYASTLYYSDTLFLLHLIFLKAHLQNLLLTAVSDNSEAVLVLAHTAHHMPTLILYWELEHSLWAFGIPVIRFLRVLYLLG